MTEKTYTKQEIVKKSIQYIKTLPLDTPLTLSGFIIFLFSPESSLSFSLPDSPLFDRELFLSLYNEYKSLKQEKERG